MPGHEAFDLQLRTQSRLLYQFVVWNHVAEVFCYRHTVTNRDVGIRQYLERHASQCLVLGLIDQQRDFRDVANAYAVQYDV